LKVSALARGLSSEKSELIQSAKDYLAAMVAFKGSEGADSQTYGRSAYEAAVALLKVPHEQNEAKALELLKEALRVFKSQPDREEDTYEMLMMLEKTIRQLENKKKDEL
jgi:hypothetical protein